jgi:hypothetical protein
MRIRVGIGGIVVLVLGGTVFFATRTGTNDSTDLLLEETAPTGVTLSRSYKEGVHTFTGIRSMPTVCDSVSADALLHEEGGIEVRITETPADGMCLMRTTPMEFSVTIEAPEDASVSASVNGVPVEVVIE